MPLSGKSIFITGGTGGIGTPLVKLLQQAGASVHVYTRQQDGDLIDNLNLISNKLAEIAPDILINMAGANAFDFAENQDYQALIDLNLMVPMRLTQAVLPAMKARGNGQIVNIGSMTGLIPLPFATGYVAAKAGLKGFNDALRRELQGTGIAVTNVVPRAVRTAANSGLGAEYNERTGVHYDDPDAVAAAIFNAITKQQTEVRLGWPERLFAFINANLPFLIDSGMEKNRKVGEQLLTKQHHNKEPKNESNTPIARQRAAS